MVVNKYSGRDIIDFFLLFSGAIISVYFLPEYLAFIYFGILLFLFWRSEKNGFWFILVFLFIDPPGNLFPEDFNYGLPFIKGVNIRFIELFIWTALIKALFKRKQFLSQFTPQYQVLFLLTVLLLIYTFIIDTSILSLAITIKRLFMWSLLFSIPKLIDTQDEWHFIFKMSFIIVFIGLAFQFLHLVLGHPPSYLLGTDFNPIMDYGENALEQLDPNEYNLKEARPVSSISIMQLALTGAMFFLRYKKNEFPRVYLYLVIIFSYFSIILTATRGWFIAFSVVILIYFTFILKVKRIISIGIILIILIPLVVKVPIVQRQLEGSFKRLSTVQNIVKGDLSAGGTSARYDYSKTLIQYWKESPILGWAFTNFNKKNGNGHAGLANMLFSVGIIGYLVFIYFWYKLFTLPLFINRRLSLKNPFKGSLTIFSLVFLIFLVLHSTSGQQFGIYLSFGGGIFSQTFFYGYSSYYITKSIELEKTQYRELYHS